MLDVTTDHKDVLLAVIDCARRHGGKNRNNSIFHALDSMEKWAKGNAKKPWRQPEPELQKKSALNKAREINKHLEKACRRLLLTHDVEVKVITVPGQDQDRENELRLSWKSCEDGESRIVRRKWEQIDFYTPYHENSFVDLLLMGAQSAALEATVPMDIHRVDSDQQIIEMINADERKNVLRVVDWVSQSEKERFLAYLDKEKLEGLRDTANTGACVYQNNGEIGRLAASWMLTAGLEPHHLIALTRPTGINGVRLDINSPTEQRIQGFLGKLCAEWQVAESDLLPSVRFIEFPDMRHGGAVSLIASKSRELRGPDGEIDVAFATSGGAGLGLALGASAVGLEAPIVSADFTPELFELLRERGSLVEALVGVDPYTYGKNKIRLAMNLGSNEFKSIPPSLLTKGAACSSSRGWCSTFEFSRDLEEKGTACVVDDEPAVESDAAQVVVALAGGSGCGKSSLASEIQRRGHPKEVAVFSMDWFYREELGEHLDGNYDHPDAVDWPYLLRCLSELTSREYAAVPVYRFNGSRRSVARTLISSQILIVEGLHTLDARLSSAVQLRYFLDVDEEERLKRRIERDCRLRGRTEQSVREKWDSHVAPMFREHVETKRRELADHEVLESTHLGLADAADLVLTRARAMLA